MKPAQCRNLAKFFRFFSNPIRLRILCALSEGEQSVGDISKAVGGTKYYVSQQIRLLRLAGIISQRKAGKFVYCALREGDLIRALRSIETVARGSYCHFTGGLK